MRSPNRSDSRPSRPGAAARVLYLVLSVALAAPLAAQELSDADTQRLAQYAAAMPLLETARMHIDTGDFARAEALLSGLVATTPEMSDAQLLLAKSRYAQGRFAAALTSIEKAKASFDATATLMARVRAARKAQLATEREKHLTTIRSLESAGGAAPKPEAIDTAREAVRLLDAEEKALDDADFLTMPAEYPFFRGNVLLRMGRNGEAVEEYRAALAIDPTYRPAANNLASVYFEAKRYEQAREVIEQIEARGATVNPELKRRVLEAIARK